MNRFAENTTVPIETTKAEIEKLLRRYGAAQFISGWDENKGMIGFTMENRQVKFILPMPRRDDFKQTPTGRWRRSENSIDLAWERGQRSSWRALKLVIKAKLESVAAGIFTFEQEFMPHIVLPDGQTIGEFMIPQIEAVYRTEKMPLLLAAGGPA